MPFSISRKEKQMKNILQRVHLGFLFVVLCLFTTSNSLQAQWIQTNEPSGVIVYSFAVSGTNLFSGTSNGVFLSTDNGTNWTAVNNGLPSPTYVGALAINGINIFAGTGGAENRGIFLSTNNGTSWSTVNTGLPATPVNAFAVNDTNIFAATNSGVFLSTNNGTSWTTVNTGLLGYAIWSLAVSPNGTGNTNLFAGTYNGVFLSTNNGTSWTKTSTGLTSTYVNTFAVSPNGIGGTNLFAGTNGGVFLSTNNGASWTSSGLTNTHIRALVVYGTILFAGTDGGVFLSTNNGTSWIGMSSGLTSGMADSVVTSLFVTSTNLFAGTDFGTASIRLSYFSVLTPPTLNYPLSGALNQPLSPTLYWSGDSDAFKYHLQVSKDSSFTSIDYDDSTITANSKRGGPLASNTVYYWRVSGLNLAGTSLWSTTWHFTTHDVFPPVLVSPSDNSLNQPLSPTLSWNAAPYVTAYHLQVAADSTFSSTVFDNSSIAATSKQIVSLVSNTKYYWKVATIDSGNISSWSATWHFLTQVLSPTGIVAGPGNRKVILSWQPSSSPDVFKYKIYRATSSPASTLHDSTTASTYADSGLTNGTQYFYRITAENSQFIEGPFSTEVAGKPFNQAPHANSLNNVYQPNSGAVPSVAITFSSSSSYDSDGTVDSIFWYVDGKLMSQQSQFTHEFFQGTKNVMLVVEDNQGGKDTSLATVNRSMFKVALNGPVYAGPSLLGTNILYVIGTSDAVYKMDAVGNVLYSLKVGGEIRSSSSIAYDTTVYIASSDNNLYAFSGNGTSLWPALPLGGELSATAAIDSAANRIYIGVANGNFVGVDRTTGKAAWNYFVDAPIVGSAAITLDRKLVVATVKGTVYGFDLTALSSSPTPSWQISLSDSIFGSPAIDAEGNIYYCTGSGKVDKITMPVNQQASSVWQTPLGGSITGSPVIDGNGALYVGSADGKLYAIDIQGGNIKWSYPSGAPIFSTPAVSNVNMIYFGNHGGEVFAIDTNEVLHWYYQDSTSVDAPLLYSNGVLYAGTIGGRLLAFYDKADSTVGGSSMAARLSKVKSKPIVPVWGTFQGNNQRTGMPTGKVITAVTNAKNGIPNSYSLSQNFPNPINPSTKISYQLPKTSFVTLRVYDILGREVSLLVNEQQNAGTYEVTFDANHLASGVYFYRIEAGSFVQTRKLVLMK